MLKINVSPVTEHELFNHNHKWNVFLFLFCILWNSLQPRIIQSVRELGDLLQNIKGSSSLNNTNQVAQRNAVAVEADEVLRPLMDLLDGSLSLYAQSCEKTVLKRLLKELWKIVMRILEKTIVLPPITDRTVSDTS